MSDIQDLIHKTTMDCLERGRREKQERIINDLKDQFAFGMGAETKEGLDQLANSIQWSERWQLTFNDLIALIEGKK